MGSLLLPSGGVEKVIATGEQGLKSNELWIIILARFIMLLKWLVRKNFDVKLQYQELEDFGL